MHLNEEREVIIGNTEWNEWVLQLTCKVLVKSTALTHSMLNVNNVKCTQYVTEVHKHYRQGREC